MKDDTVSQLLVGSETTEDQPLEWVEYQEKMALLRSLRGASPQAIELAELQWVFGWSTNELIEATGLTRAAIDQHKSRVRKAALRARDLGLF